MTESAPLTIPCIDSRRDDAVSLITALREKLSPRGNIVSEAGRERTAGWHWRIGA